MLNYGATTIKKNPQGAQNQHTRCNSQKPELIVSLIQLAGANYN